YPMKSGKVDIADLIGSIDLCVIRFVEVESSRRKLHEEAVARQSLRVPELDVHELGALLPAGEHEPGFGLLRFDEGGKLLAMEEFIEVAVRLLGKRTVKQVGNLERREILRVHAARQQSDRVVVGVAHPKPDRLNTFAPK